MKNIIIICLIFALPIRAKAQSAFSSVNQVTVNGVVFKCETFSYTTYVSNTQNITNGDWDNNPTNTELSDECAFGLKGVINYTIIKSVFYNVFSPQRRQELISEELGVILFIKPLNGEIKELNFDLSQNTQITPQEIYQLEVALKGKMMPPREGCAAMVFKAFPFTFDFKNHQP